jgi:catechol 2,3-dioxygenase-like lactoylglutathione lyase family enzyme
MGMAGIRGLLEIVLAVQDLERSAHFYREVLGLTAISPPNLPALFLRVGDETGVPQQIVLVPRPAGSAALPADRMQRGLHHIGLEIASADFEAERARLQGLGFVVRTGEHPFLNVQAIYVDDPDGNEVEIVAAKA